MALVALERPSDGFLDHSTSLKWLTEAAGAGEPTATLNLAMRLFEGDGVPPDARSGERFVRNQANTGEPVAMRILGVLLCEGNHLSLNRDEGFEWLQPAASTGDAKAQKFISENARDN